MTRVAQALAWMRSHRMVSFYGALALVVLVAAGSLIVLSNRPVRVTQTAATGHATHDETSGPNIEPLPEPGASTPGSTTRPENMPTTTTMAKRPGGSTASGGDKKPASVVTSPLPADNGGLGITTEAKQDLPRVKTPLPQSLTLPAGSVLVNDPAQYSNGVLQWMYTNERVAYPDMVNAVRNASKASGWQLTSEAATFTYPDMSGAPISMKRFYVTNGNIRGYVSVSSRVGKPGSTLQIDLLGV